MTGVYDVFFANNLKRIWSFGHSPSGSHQGGLGVKGHPRRESKMTRNLTKTFRSGTSGSFCGRHDDISPERINYRAKRGRFRWQPKVMNNIFYRTKYMVCVICLVICLYQLIKFLALYFSYQTSVDAEVLIDTNPQLPGITLCYNTFLHDNIMCNKSTDYCKLFDKLNVTNIRDDISQFLHEKEYQIDMIRKCAFRYYNNTDDLKTGQECVSAWAFNGIEPCTVINAEWAETQMINTGGYSEFMYGVESHVPQLENGTITLGVDVFIHSPTDIPTRHIRSYFITLSSVYKANFKKTIVHRMAPPFQTMCYDYKEQRDKHKEFKYVSQQTCYYDCLWKYLSQACGCIPTPFPFILPYKACNTSTKASCKRDTKTWSQICDEQCPIACVGYFRTYVEVFHELRGNIVVIFTHKPQITSVEIFSNIGGYLGIWLGMSVPLLYDLLVYTMFVLFKSVSNTETQQRKFHYDAK